MHIYSKLLLLLFFIAYLPLVSCKKSEPSSSQSSSSDAVTAETREPQGSAVNETESFVGKKSSFHFVSGSIKLVDRISDESNPGGIIHHASCTTRDGTLYLFGGLNDLQIDTSLKHKLNPYFWKFDGKEWTRIISGAGPVPRIGASAWCDQTNGNFYLFGGQLLYGSSGSNLKLLNDLWKFDGSNWILIGGSPNSFNLKSISGVMGKPDPENFPGSRSFSSVWQLPDGTIYLFGGIGFDQNDRDYAGDLNQLWKFDGIQWTLLKGSIVRDRNQSLQTRVSKVGSPDPSNTPGRRSGAGSWVGLDGGLYLFGGLQMNDLWKYDGQDWILIAGDPYEKFSKGTIGKIPSGRMYPATWVGAKGELYLFGGYGIYSGPLKHYGSAISLGDVWKFFEGKWHYVGGEEWVTPKIDPRWPQNNCLGSRYGSIVWRDTAGRLLLYGGKGRDGNVRLNPLPYYFYDAPHDQIWEYAD